MTYKWTKDLETGNLTIDSQHQELLQAINQLLEACQAGKGGAHIAKTCTFLVDYTKRHFQEEEKIQMQYRYPDYPNHKKYHTEFVRVAQDLVKEIQANPPTAATIAKINSILGAWLINHIMKEDKKLIAHIKSQA